jgi:hypothetical protein
MIPHGVEIFVGLEPIDLRSGFNRLSGIVTERMARPPRSGALFVFFGKRRDALRILFADGSGLCLFSKRLDRSKEVASFDAPPSSSEARTVSLDEPQSSVSRTAREPADPPTEDEALTSGS